MQPMRQPLLRLLALNLGIGAIMAMLMLGGLLTLNPGRLRDLIFADQSGGAALGLLLFGFLVTFGSSAMGAAVMMLGKDGLGADGHRAGRDIGPAASARAPRQPK